MPDLTNRLHNALACGALDLPVPGSGLSAQRFLALYEFALADLSTARLAEAHTDAVAILAEAGRSPVPNALYGVWASDGSGSELSLRQATDATYFLEGTKRYCSGARIVERALVTARTPVGIVLVDISMRVEGIEWAPSSWASPAFAETCTATVEFHRTPVSPDALIGPPDWYLTRRGFWLGAIAPAACWAGGAAGLIRAARKLRRKSSHSRAQMGALEANDWAARAFLEEAARQIDSHPDEGTEEARLRAIKVRHLIERLCTDTLDRFGRATGPQLLAFDAAVAQRHAELSLYIRQCHAEQDLETLTSYADPG